MQVLVSHQGGKCAFQAANHSSKENAMNTICCSQRPALNRVAFCKLLFESAIIKSSAKTHKNAASASVDAMCVEHL